MKLIVQNFLKLLVVFLLSSLVLSNKILNKRRRLKHNLKRKSFSLLLTNLRNNAPFPIFEFSDQAIFQKILQLKKDIVLGKGGWGNVYIANKVHTNSLLAVKEFSTKENGVDEANSNKEIMNNLSSIKGYKNYLGVIEEAYYLKYNQSEKFIVTMPFYPGTFLEMYKSEEFYYKSLIFYMHHLAKALQMLHSKKMSHNDLKPANIAVNADSYPVLIDFGLLCENVSDTSGCKFPTTASYVCPEMIKYLDEIPLVLPSDYAFSRAKPSYEEKGTRCDIWQFGMVLLEMLQRKKVFANYNSTVKVKHLFKTKSDDYYKAIIKMIYKNIDKNQIELALAKLKLKNDFTQQVEYYIDLLDNIATFDIEEEIKNSFNFIETDPIDTMLKNLLKLSLNRDPKLRTTAEKIVELTDSYKTYDTKFDVNNFENIKKTKE